MQYRLIQVNVLIVCIAIAANAGCGGPSAYTNATVKYADSIDASAPVVRAGGDLAGRICLEKAWFTYLQAKLYLASDSNIPWSKWLSTAKASPKLAWNAYCAEVRQSAKAVNDALGVLAQYAAALRSLAEQGVYDGADIGAMVESAGELGGDSMTSQAAQSLRNPVQMLTGMLVSKYTDGKLQRFAIQANPHIEQLLEGIQTFLAALSQDLDMLERLSGPVFDVLEATAFPSEANVMGACRAAAFNHDACKLDHVKVHSFLTWSTSFSQEMASRREAISALDAALTSLRKTQKKFVEAAPPDRGTKGVVGGVSATLTQLAKAKDAFGTEKE